MNSIKVNIPNGNSGDFLIKKIPCKSVFGGDTRGEHTVLYKKGAEAITQDTLSEYKEYQPL